MDWCTSWGVVEWGGSLFINALLLSFWPSLRPTKEERPDDS